MRNNRRAAESNFDLFTQKKSVHFIPIVLLPVAKNGAHLFFKEIIKPKHNEVSFNIILQPEERFWSTI